MRPFNIAVFTEDEFNEVITQEFGTLGEARAYVNGLMRGTDYYGAGSCIAFVLPEDVEDLRSELRTYYDWDQYDEYAEKKIAYRAQVNKALRACGMPEWP